jgi:hypothetical protein
MPKKSASRKVQTGKNGARFVWRVSKKTGKRYKQYLPRRTRVIRSPCKAAKGMVFVPFR